MIYMYLHVAYLHMYMYVAHLANKRNSGEISF